MKNEYGRLIHEARLFEAISGLPPIEVPEELRVLVDPEDLRGPAQTPATPPPTETLRSAAPGPETPEVPSPDDPAPDR